MSSLTKKFLDLFPPPQFLDVPFAGLVFSDANIRLLSLNRFNFHPEIFLEVPLPDGAIEAGIIKEEGEVERIIKELKSKIRQPFVKFAVPDEISYVFTAEVPVLRGGDIKESVSFILEENVPLPLSDISFDFTPIKIEEGKGTLGAQVVVTALSSSVISTYIKALRNAGLEPIRCVNESQSIARSVIPAENQSNTMIAYIHRNTVGIYITEGRVVEFSSIVQIPPNSSRELLTSFVIAEIKKSLYYWKEKMSRAAGDEIDCLLCGKYEECRWILESNPEVEGLRVSLGNVWQNAFSLHDYIPDISFEDSLRFAGAIGLFV